MKTPPSPHRRGGALWFVLLLLALVAGGGWWYWQSQKPAKTTWITQEVERGDVTQIVTATGTLNPVINVEVGSQISGMIQNLYADYNSPVKEGQLIAMIEPSTYEATVIQAEGELASAQASLELARINEKRARELDARKAAPKASLDEAVAALRQAEAQVKIREGSLKRARVDRERCEIHSPVDGIVISRSVNVGQTVAASLSAPVLFTIANDLAKMQINANVAEADVGNVEEGQAVEFTVDAFPTRTFRGEATQVRNAATTVQNVVSYDVIISVNNADLKLKPGMTANASIIIARSKDALRISGAALRFRPPAEDAATPATSPGRRPSGGSRRGSRGKGEARQSERTIYRLVNGEPVATKIRTGISDGIYTEVTEGLEEGAFVITGMSSGQAATASPQTTNPFMPQRPPGGRR